MAELTSRQKQAEAMMRELKQLGAFVTNDMPLRDDAKLTFQVMDTDRDMVLSKISNWRWSPVLRNHGIRFCGDYVARPCTTYEIDPPRERQPIHDDRIIRGDVGEKLEKTPSEVTAMRKYLGMK